MKYITDTTNITLKSVYGFPEMVALEEKATNGHIATFGSSFYFLCEDGWVEISNNGSSDIDGKMMFFKPVDGSYDDFEVNLGANKPHATYYIADKKVVYNNDLVVNNTYGNVEEGVYVWQTNDPSDNTPIDFIDFIDISTNKVKEMDISENWNIMHVDCDRNELTELDFTTNVMLQSLRCQRNQLTSLEFSRNEQLSFLDCNRNQLSGLNIYEIPALTYLKCNRNPFNLGIDTSTLEYLETLICDYCNLDSLDFTYNRLLSHIEIEHNNLDYIDVSMLDNLQYFRCFNNNLKSLDLTQNIDLEWVRCENNSLSVLDLPNSTTLYEIQCQHNDLVSYDISNLPSLRTLLSFGNELTSLDLTNSPLLERVECDDNNLSSVDFKNHQHLNKIDCYRNHLTSLDLSNTPSLKDIRCFSNQITHITASDSPDVNYKLYSNPILGADLDDFFNGLPTSTTNPTIQLGTSVPIDGLSACDINIAINKGYTVVTS